MLGSAVRVVSEYGYAQMTVARVAGGARVSRRTFYQLFDDRESCFLAVFDDGVTQVSERVRAAYGAERGWRARVRGGLVALLELLDEQPGMGSLLVVDALQAGPRVQERRATVLNDLADALQRDGLRAAGGRRIPPLTGEGVVGALLGVIHTRLSAGRHGSMRELLNPLVGMVVLSYLGAAAAQSELERPSPERDLARRTSTGGGVSSASFLDGDPLAGLQMRLTGRTLLVLQAIGEQPGASNREVGDLAEVHDQGQISKLLTRLEKLGLIQNATRQKRSQPIGAPNAWRLTARGAEIWQVVTDLPAPFGAPSSTDRGDVPSDHNKGMVR